MTLYNTIKVIQGLKDVKGKLNKEQYLKDVIAVNPDAKRLLTILLDSKYALGLKKLGTIGISASITQKSNTDLFELITEMLDNNMTDTLRHKVLVFLGMCSADIQDTLKELLQKTLVLGITANTFKKVFPESIQDHPIALAKAIGEAQYKLPCILGLKYDGIRYTQVGCNSQKKGVALTRDRNVMDFHRIQDGIKQLLKGLDGEWVVDGELETIDRDFDKVQGIVSSNISDGYNPVYDSQLVFTVFDIIRLSDYLGETESKPQDERLLDLSKLFLINKPQGLEEGEYNLVYTEAKLKELVDDYIVTKGLEGGIIKEPKARYKKGKTSAWIKVKAINDCTLECVGINYSTMNSRNGLIASLQLKSSCGLIEVSAGSGLTKDTVKLYTDKPPIGMFFDILFNQVTQAEGSVTMSLRFPRVKGQRIDVTKADDFAKIKAQHIGAMKLKGE